MEMNPTLIALAETILYSECDDNSVPLDANYFVQDFDEESLKKLYGEYQQFLSVVEEKIIEKIGEEWDCIDDFYDLAQPALNQTEYDYILTRNRHGAGFWDGDWSDSVSEILTDAAQAQGEFDVYVGDDQKIYLL
jgi:hypothetical protein